MRFSEPVIRTRRRKRMRHPWAPQIRGEDVSYAEGQRPEGPPRTLRPLEGEGEAQRSLGVGVYLSR